jgi:PRC-barrel domain
MRASSHLLNASAAICVALLIGGAQAATTANPAPDAGTRAAASAGNEIDKAVGPDRPVSSEEISHAVALSAIDNPARALATAEIKNRRGQAVGKVSSVDVGPDGIARAVSVDVGGFLGIGEHRVAIRAASLSYLKSRDLLVTTLSKKQIEALAPQPAPHG